MTNTYSTNDNNRSNDGLDGSINLLIKQANKEGVIIIADTAGMGKTTVLTDLTKKIKENDASRWVAGIDLINHPEELKNPFEFADPEIALKFVIDDLLKIRTD